MALAGYTLETLRPGNDFTLYRGRHRDAAPPVLVLISTDAARAGAGSRPLEHEYSLAEELDQPWAVRPLELSSHNGQLALVLEDPGGAPLSTALGRPLDLAQFLTIAISITAALRELHKCGLIHKRIEPGNVFIDGGGNPRLTGFGMASRLPREHAAPAPPEVIAGTFAYMAPEQTGRMNRSIDSRSDLYSLGVLFYEMLTGEPPFSASDPMEWIHCHIARQPAPPSERVSTIPGPVTAIVLKLLAKNAEDRYQTAAGVEADLRRCMSEWELRRHIDPFTLAENDASDRLRIPEKLYGREADIENLVAAFDRVVALGTTELVLISGYAGIGKSSVVNELHKVLVPPRGLFAAGKFDQYKRNIPYATVAQAFSSLVRQLLIKDDEELSRWRAAFIEALGSNGQLMVNLIPELALIIGTQPPVPELPPQESQNRFQRVFRRFLDVFARPEHPLALFLDDLQWLDTATLDLLEHLATHPEVRHVLLIGAYRDNEVGPAHSLPRVLNVIRDAGSRVQEIVLGPLTLDNTTQLVAESLHCGRETASPLAELVHEKTAGNPFFAIQFFTALADENLLRFDHGSGIWTWDLPRIRAKGFTDNVVDFMAAKIGRLSEATQSALAQLSCLGNSVEVATIITVHGCTEEQIQRALAEALGSGLILYSDNAYKFLHDRVQEAAYGPMPSGKKTAEHLLIGRALSASIAETGNEDAVFDAVDHLNNAVTLIATQEELERLLELNIVAGKRARHSNAYAAARNYLAQAASMLRPGVWQRNYAQAFDLYFALSECEYLIGNFKAADDLFTMMLENARFDSDRAKVESLRIKLYQVAGKYDDGVTVALNALRSFGVTFAESESDIRAAIEAHFREVPVNLAGRSIEDLIEAPVAADPTMRAIINLLVDATPCAYIARPSLFPLISLEAVNRSLRYGNAEQSSFAYTIYAIMLVSIIGDIPSAFQYSEMSLRLNEKFNNVLLRGTLLHLHGDHINFWRRPIATDLPILDRALVACLEVGDLVYAGFLAFETVWQLIEKGDNLEDVLAQSIKYAAFAQQSHNDAVYETIRMEQQFVASIAGKTAKPLSFEDDAFDEAACFDAVVKATFGCGIVFYHIMKQMLAFHSGQYAAALESAIRAEPVLGAAMAMPIEATYHFYHALILAALFPTASGVEQHNYRQALDDKLKKLKLWAENSPENYSNRYALVSAEVARIEGRDFDAMHLYDDAIRSAHDHDFIQNAALANELAAGFYAARGFQTIADVYLRNARACYLRWGAVGKVRQLDEIHPQLRREPISPRDYGTIGTPVEHLDLATVIRVSQLISGEIDLDRLIDTLMRIALEHAGATRGLLILQRGDQLQIEAEAVTVRDTVDVRLRHAPVSASELPDSILRSVVRTGDSVLLADAAERNPFSADDYIRIHHPRSILCMPLIKQTELVGVLYLENGRAAHVFTEGRSAILGIVASQAAISLEHARLYMEAKLREEEMQKLVSLIDNSTDFIGFAFLSSQCAFVNAAGRRLVGLEPDEDVTVYQLSDFRSAEDHQYFLDEILPALSRDGHWEGERTLRHFKTKVDIPIYQALFFVTEKGTNRRIAIATISRDISVPKQKDAELRASLEEKDALLKEVHHRVKNNLQLISSLLNLQASRVADPGAAEQLKESRDRIRSMALVHENLYRAGNFARIPIRNHIQNLCAHVIRAYGPHNRNIGLVSDVDDIELGLDQAISVGLIINELVSNSLKHAFPDNRSGSVSVELKLLDGRRCELCVKDDGIGLPSDLDSARTHSLGLQLVHDLTEQLHGSLHTSNDQGTTFCIIFDADDFRPPGATSGGSSAILIN